MTAMLPIDRGTTNHGRHSVKLKAWIAVLVIGGICAAAAITAKHRASIVTGSRTFLEKDAMAPGSDWETVATSHPAGDVFKRLFPTPPAPSPADFKPSGTTRKDYLTLIA